MAAIDVPDSLTQTRRIPWASVLGSVTAAGLFLASAALQLMASLQRWVVFRGARGADDVSAEDHLYDYSFPYDPWVPIGTAAQLYGAGVLLMAAGVLVLPLGVGAVTRKASRHSVRVISGISEILLAILVAGAFAIDGVHALVSGLAGTPSALQHSGAVGLIAIPGLIGLALLWRASRAALLACVFLLGSTALGYLLAAFFIAPLVAGGGSHDTTPWTETVIAASTAAAGIAVLFAARAVGRRTGDVR